MDVATTATGSSLDLHISIYVTCLCDPLAVPPIPNMDVIVDGRPSVSAILKELIFSCSSPGGGKEGGSVEGQMVPPSPSGSGTSGSGAGGIAVCASGPCSLIRESQNAVASMSVVKGVDVGGIALHTEAFML
jgi:ferric-chelate reductase